MNITTVASINYGKDAVRKSKMNKKFQSFRALVMHLITAYPTFLIFSHFDRTIIDCMHFPARLFVVFRIISCGTITSTTSIKKFLILRIVCNCGTSDILDRVFSDFHVIVTAGRSVEFDCSIYYRAGIV